jgi:TRAP-type C4-dicarboxylate transport system permease small subunit
VPHNPANRRGLAPELERRIGRIIGMLARALAWIGGLVLVALVVMTCISIAGRALVSYFPTAGFGPVPGDFELVEAGCGFAIFAFLPWCQYRRGHVTVDVFVSSLGPRALALLSLIGNLILTAVALLLAWRMQLGLTDKLSYGETTMILQMPVWWPFALALTGAWVFVLVSAYTVWRSLNEALGAGEPAA